MKYAHGRDITTTSRVCFVHFVQDTVRYGINDRVNLVQKPQTNYHPPPILGTGKALYGSHSRERLILRDPNQQTLPQGDILCA
jgi:hypothetical protein